MPFQDKELKLLSDQIINKAINRQMMIPDSQIPLTERLRESIRRRKPQLPKGI